MFQMFLMLQNKTFVFNWLIVVDRMDTQKNVLTLTPGTWECVTWQKGLCRYN